MQPLIVVKAMPRFARWSPSAVGMAVERKKSSVHGALFQ
jgi:hypothetical protein